jgi:hypothetical protein
MVETVQLARFAHQPSESAQADPAGAFDGRPRVDGVIGRSHRGAVDAIHD